MNVAYSNMYSFAMLLHSDGGVATARSGAEGAHSGRDGDAPRNRVHMEVAEYTVTEMVKRAIAGGGGSFVLHDGQGIDGWQAMKKNMR